MELPSILSGPIIRRAESRQVYIWVATSAAYQTEAELYQVTNVNETEKFHYDPIDTIVETETIKFGTKLYINLIKIVPTAGELPAATLIGYNLRFNNDNTILDLQSLQLLSPDNPHSLVYGNLAYPAFYISNSSQSKFLYGSCRKMFGIGEDALVSGDLTLEETHSDLNQRPNALFLTGDQIYADDIADPVQPCLSNLAKVLIGEKEQLSQLDARLGNEPFSTAVNKVHGRQFIMDHFASFTSGNAANHLIQFGEYAAMYLLSWGPELWNTAIEEGMFYSLEELMEKDSYYFVYADETCYQTEREKERVQHEIRYHQQWQEVDRFRQNSARIRRLLANIPTYMIFDDHDITDDWNLSAEWKNEVWRSPLGRHTVANGLTAYWAFQGWGNEPDRFDGPFLKTIRRYFDTFKPNTLDYENWVKKLWEFADWSFVAPTKPKAIFLDTRTQRFYDSIPQPAKAGKIIEENVRSPQLIGPEQWRKLTIKLQKSNWQPGEDLIIISATPLYGIELIESFLYEYIYSFRAVGVPVETLLDFEAWKYNGQGFHQFLQWIIKQKPRRCFILSGDVHYASTVQSDVVLNSGESSAIYQFTSSPLKNMSFTSFWGTLIRKIIGLNTRKWKKNKLYRYCNQNHYLLIKEQEADCSPSFLWKETIRYLPTKKGVIMDTTNNLGLLSIDSNSVQNALLKYYGVYKQTEHYPLLKCPSSRREMD